MWKTKWNTPNDVHTLMDLQCKHFRFSLQSNKVIVNVRFSNDHSICHANLEVEKTR